MGRGQIIGRYLEEEAIRWARAQMNLEGPVGNCIAWSMADEDGFIAVFVLSDINAVSACLHFAARPGARWLTKEFARGIMGLAFDDLHLSRLTGPIRGSNLRAQQVAGKWGFRYEGALRKAFPNGDDCVLMGLLRQEWKSHKWCDSL